MPSMFHTWVSKEQAFDYGLYWGKGIRREGILVSHTEEDERGEDICSVFMLL